MKHFRTNYDISNGLPPTIKNRLEKKKCNSCGVWMRIDSLFCFCCGQRLSKRGKKAARAGFHHNYPTYKDLNMIPAYVQKEINRLSK
jgi:hypothetical protein